MPTPTPAPTSTSTPRPTFTPRPTPTPTAHVQYPFTIIYADPDSYSEGQRQELAYIAGEVAQYYVRRFGYDEPNKLIKISKGRNLWEEDDPFSTIYLYTDGEDFKDDFRAFYTSLVAHEYGHSL